MPTESRTGEEHTIMARWESYLAEREGQSLGELQDILSIPSISSLPEHAGDLQVAAEWTANRLREAGVENDEIMPTGGPPVVYGDWAHGEGKRTLLVYVHFDLQPV